MVSFQVGTPWKCFLCIESQAGEITKNNPFTLVTTCYNWVSYFKYWFAKCYGISIHLNKP